MGKRLFKLLAPLAALLIVDLAYYAVFKPDAFVSSIAFFLVSTFVLFLILVGLAYKSLFDFKSPTPRIVLFLGSITLVSMFVASRWLAINQLYFQKKHATKYTSGDVWQVDKDLGHTGIPNAKGFYHYQFGDSIGGEVPIHMDGKGYRTTEVESRIKGDSTILFLGCSFTFGDFIKAEEGFPFCTAESLQLPLINAGASAYGFGQMAAILESLTDSMRFKYIFIQLSPWLADRSMSLIGPSAFGYRPFPYFSDTDSGFEWQPPAFSAFDYSKRKNWRASEASYLEKLRFSFSEGLRVELKDYLAFRLAQLKALVGIIPQPTANRAALELFIYDSMIELIRQKGAIPVVYKLYYPEDACASLVQSISERAHVIDLDKALSTYAEQNNLDPGSDYRIKAEHAGREIIVDDHPNALANKIICNSILAQLKHTD